jgi:glycosyltransferase involved in cell wall biosynthesis
MKVVMMNYDFKVFWKGRLIYLHHFLAAKYINFQAIELFGKGSAYSFDTYDNEENWWTCLFPNNNANEVSKKEMKKALFDKLDSINPDIIIASSIVFFAGALGIRWAKKNKKKFIVFENAKPSQFKRNFLVQGVKDLILKQADGFWLPSNDYDKEYPEFFNKMRFFYGYCCVDNDLFKNKSKNEFDHNNLLCIARLVPIKNIDNLLRAWEVIEQKANNWKLNIIGDGTQLDSLTKLSADLNLKNVTFLGAVDNKNTPSYLFDSDGFILPSLSETWGLVVNEAMAAGLPVLLSNKINAAHTLMKEGENGFGFDPLNINEIAEAVLKYTNLANEEKQNMSAKSLELIDSMSYEKMGSTLAEALFEIKAHKFKRPGPLATLLISLWDGRYSTFAWNKL